MPGLDLSTHHVYGPAVMSSVAADLRVALGDAGEDSAAVLVHDEPTGRWLCVAGALPMSEEGLADLVAQLGPDVGRKSVWGGRAVGYPLRGERRLLGALVVSADSELADPTGDQVLGDLLRCLTSTLDAADQRAEGAFLQRAARAVRRLFVEGANARDVREAGTVLARVAADAFQAERAGMCVIDEAGVICFTGGFGVAAELSEALAAALTGAPASLSPAWQSLERLGGPDFVDDTRLVPVRPKGFVETLNLRSYVAIPLMAAEGPLGMVICGDVSRQRTWTARERELAAQFAVEGALIIDAARLRTAQREQLALLSHQAHHDGLTGLANRRMLMTRLDETLEAARADGSKVALLLLDLNDFKRVNDTLGHRYGDELLREVANRLRETVRESDTLARLGGDEFAVILPGVSGDRRALATALRIERALTEPVILGGVRVNAAASIGIAMFPASADSSADLLQHADVAMYAAKRSRNGAAVYDRSIDDTTVERLSLYTELRSALADGELRLHHQPKLDLQRDVIVGVESLVRWQHPRRGMLAPGEFLTLAESCELIHPLTAWVFAHAVEQQRAWADLGVDLNVAVNISARNLLNQGLIARVRDHLRTSGAPERFIVEVTETAVMTDPKQSIESLKSIRDLGARISMDDFGTGQSSLALLRQLPVDELKIDRQLVSAVDASAQDRALVDTIVHLGHRLGLEVVAEGIETDEVLRTVRDLGCDLGQGYVISRPVHADQIVELVAPASMPTVTTLRPDSGPPLAVAL